MPDAGLTAALAELDRVMRPARAFTFVGCPHCVSEDTLRQLRGPVELITSGAMSSVLMDGPQSFEPWPAVMHRVTPALLRLITRNELHVDEGQAATRLVSGGWREWPEQAAIRAVLDAWWIDRLQTYPESVDAQYARHLLEFLAVAVGSVRPWLAMLGATRNPAADRHLADLFSWWLPEMGAGDLTLGFHGELQVAADMVRWFRVDERARTERLVPAGDLAFLDDRAR
jgi:hypothetical protein